MDLDLEFMVEKMQCIEMTVLMGKLRKGEDKHEDRSADQEGFSGGYI